MKQSSLEHKLLLLAVNNNVPATQIMIEYIQQQGFFNQLLGYKYKNRQSHIKLYAYKALCSKYHSSSYRKAEKV